MNPSVTASPPSAPRTGAAQFLLPLVFVVLASASIMTLLAYLAGVMELRTGVGWFLLPATGLLVALCRWCARHGQPEWTHRVLVGLWAGGVATFAYDVVRVPIAASGIPVFKAISYFGTALLGQPAPTLASEITGWTYHLSNGVSFGLMYAVVVRRPTWWSASIWGLILEGLMWLTPYAEVFGYKRTSQFLAITLSAHVVYGLGLWAGMRLCGDAPVVIPAGGRGKAWWAATVLVPLGLTAIAWDFHARHARKIPPSPPPYIGPNLYITWDILEPDRVAAVWIWSRFVDREARFHYIPAYTIIPRGKPFDVPEATIRRTGTRSATEVLLEQTGLGTNAPLALLGRVTHAFEITPWTSTSDPETYQLGRALKAVAAEHEKLPPPEAMQHLTAWLDAWYARGGSLPDNP